VTPSRLRIAHLRRQLGEIEAEERAVLGRVEEVRREVEEVRWVKARRSQDAPVPANAQASRWLWWAAVVALWWIGLSYVQHLSPDTLFLSISPLTLF
jgi:cytochrome c-type biogenesis protein CcmH/NrfG